MEPPVNRAAGGPSNPGLARAIADFDSSPSDEAFAAAMEELSGCVLVIGVREIPEALRGKPVVRLAEDLQITMLGGAAPDGGRACFAFTDVAALHARKPGCPWLALGAADLAARVLDGGYEELVVNPQGPCLRLPREILDDLRRLG